MRRAALVARREYLENIRTKAFWIGILSVPVLIVIASVIPTLLGRTKGARRYAVIDNTEWLRAAVEERAAAADAERLFAQLQSLQAGAKTGDLSAWPAVLRDLAPLVKDAPPESLHAMGAVLGAGGKSLLAAEGERVKLAPEVRAKLVASRDGYLAWWRGLGATQARALKAGISRAEFQAVDPPPGGDPESVLRGWLDTGPDKLFGYFVIGADPLAGNQGNKYVSNNLTDEDLRHWFVRFAGEEIEARRFQREGVEPELARRIQAPVVFEGKQVGAGGVETAVGVKDVVRQWIPVAFVYLLWISVFMIAQMLLTNTVEEKSSRIIEVLLSSVSPIELLAGKIVGMAATGLTVVGAWIFCIIIAVKAVPRLLGGLGGLDLSALLRDPLYLTSFVVYFILGYLFYSALLVGIGSVCNSLKEAQNLVQPVMILLILPLLAMVPVGQDPNGTLARVLSFVPPFTPFVMMNRAAGPPALWEYVATTALLLVSVVAVQWAAAKIFRIGILMTGKPPKLGEILRWVRSPVGTTPER